MKTIKFLFVISIITFFVSCTEDFANPKNLVGTNWRCNYNNLDNGITTEYSEFRFTSTSEVEVWSKLASGSVKKDQSNTYSISGTTIKINSGSDSMSGTIDNKAKTMTIYIAPFVFNYTKQ